MRTAFLTLVLAAGLAFAAAFAAARWGRHTNPHDAEYASKHGPATTTAGTNQAGGAEETRRAALVRPTGVLLDALLREALASPDLIAAVKEIMAREEEDHCADTRLICLVENLPTNRLAELSGLLDANLQNEFVVRFVLGAWAQRDAAAALAWVQAHPALKRDGVHAFLLGWTRAAPESALAWLDAQPHSAVSAGLRTAVVEAMAEKDPAAALDLMKSRGWLAQHPKAILKVLQNWGGSDPAAALQGLRDLSAEMGLTSKLEAAQIGPSAFQENQSFRVMLGALLYGAFERNPLDASALLAQLTPAELALGRKAIASEVIGRDPGALKTMLELTPMEAQGDLLRSLVAETPEITLAALTQIQDRALQSEILGVAASSRFLSPETLQVPSDMRAAVMAAVSAVTDEKARGRLTSALAVGNAAQSPSWAAQLWAELATDQQLNCGPSFSESACRLRCIDRTGHLPRR